MLQRLENFVDGTWRPSRAVQALKVLKPGFGAGPGGSAAFAGRGSGCSGRGGPEGVS